MTGAAVMDVATANEADLADRVAGLCYKLYAQLPKKGKPQEGKEWTPMAAVVLQIKQGCSVIVISEMTELEVLTK